MSEESPKSNPPQIVPPPRGKPRVSPGLQEAVDRLTHACRKEGFTREDARYQHPAPDTEEGVMCAFTSDGEEAISVLVSETHVVVFASEASTVRYARGELTPAFFANLVRDTAAYRRKWVSRTPGDAL